MVVLPKILFARGVKLHNNKMVFIGNFLQEMKYAHGLS
jgi:hypothetical protein